MGRIDLTRIRESKTLVPLFYHSSENMKLYEDLRSSIQISFGLDDVVEDIIKKIKTCVEEKHGVEPWYSYVRLMEKSGLVEEKQIGGGIVYLLTDEAKELYKKFENKGYFKINV